MDAKDVSSSTSACIDDQGRYTYLMCLQSNKTVVVASIPCCRLLVPGLLWHFGAF